MVQSYFIIKSLKNMLLNWLSLNFTIFILGLFLEIVSLFAVTEAAFLDSKTGFRNK